MFNERSSRVGAGFCRAGLGRTGFCRTGFCRTGFCRYIGLALVCCLVLSAGAYAGLPVPGLVLCGQVLDQNAAMITSGGTVTVTYATGGTTVVNVTTDLAEITGAWGTFCYKVMIPMERDPASTNVLPASDTPVTYTRTLRVVRAGFTDLVDSQSASISIADSATAQFVNVNMPAVGVYHSGDLNRDHKFELNELLAEIDLFTSTPDHSYHCAWPYDVGPGSEDCTPHSGDFETVTPAGTVKGADWKFSLTELLRMIELWTATPDHSYSPDPTNQEDGFKPGASGAKADSLPCADQVGVDLPALLRIVEPTAVKGTYNVIILMDAAGTAPLTAFGIEEQLPVGWEFDGVMDGAFPDVAPPRGQAGLLEFAWLAAPAGNTFFSYQVCDHSGKAATGKVVFGEGLCRVGGVAGEMRVAVTDLRTNDANQDGTADIVENPLIINGRVIGTDFLLDGDEDAITNFLDMDPDGDGASDVLAQIYGTETDNTSQLPLACWPVAVALLFIGRRVVSQRGRKQ